MRTFFFQSSENIYSVHFGPLGVRICKEISSVCQCLPVLCVCVSNLASIHTIHECVYTKVSSRFLPNFACKFIWVIARSCLNRFRRKNKFSCIFWTFKNCHTPLNCSKKYDSYTKFIDRFLINFAYKFV